MKHIIHPMEFRIFLIAWNRLQNMATPDVHLRIADWLQRCWVSGQRRLLLMAFRSCGKSTIVGVFAAWLLYANPNLRILVLAAEGTLARRMVRNVRRIIEIHPLTPHLKPHNADQWAGERFTVNRRLELRDPSMVARGIDANITGSRADIIICDDVEVPKTSETIDKRADLREKLGELDFVLTPGGTVLYVGTPHSWFTIYADTLRTEIGETEIFLDGYERLCVPILNDAGHSAWPERYTLDDIEHLKKRTGPNRFTSQMMLEPVNIAEGRLNPAQLQRYSDVPVMIRELNRLDLGGRKLVSCSAYWDPAFGGGDGSVLAVVFGDERGDLWLQRVLYLSVPVTSQDGGGDVASAQCREVTQAVRELHIPCVTIETNGIGKYLPGILRRELGYARIPCAVREHTNTRPKDLRILESFDTVMAAHILHAHDSVFRTPFLTEMREWKPGKSGGHDDGLDAVAGALAMAPMILNSERIPGGHTWHGAKTHTAKTEFEV